MGMTLRVQVKRATWPESSTTLRVNVWSPCWKLRSAANLFCGQPGRHSPARIVGVVGVDQIPSVAVGNHGAVVVIGAGNPAEVQRLAGGDIISVC